MKRALTVTALLAVGIFVASPFAAAQDAPASTSGGQITVGALGVKNIVSSKFTEYRDVPKGIAIPYASLFSNTNGLDLYLDAHNVRQTDQRYTGWLNAGWIGVAFDYNQTPHNMGNAGRTIFAESTPGVWTMSQTLRQVLQTAYETRLPTATRTFEFYSDLLAPTFASASLVDVSSLRKRGTVDVNVGQNLPFDLTFSYLRESKSGYRGLNGGNIRGGVNPSYEVPGPLDELTQDFGLRGAYNFKAGSVYASFNRNLYNNRAETLTIDNPFQAVDALVAGGVGGPSRDRITMAPDNEASTGKAGFLLKFARQTRIGGSLSLASWTQNAPFYPYTANSAVLTPTGGSAASVAALPQSSYNGKINTTALNVTFTSRPINGLGLRAQFRSYDLTDKSGRWVSTGDSSVPHQNWNVVTPAADRPWGRLTANVYDTKTTRFTGSASYDIGALTLEGQVRSAKLERTSREATTGKDNGFAVTAIFHANEWLGVRGTYDQAKRTAEGHTVYGFQMDEAERETKRTGIDVELTPISGVAVSAAYFRRDVQYPGRPDRIQVTSGVPAPGAQPIPGTPSGLLDASYDSYTGEISITPSDRLELGAYYTYEKDATTNQWSTTTGASLNNLQSYLGNNTVNTFGANAVVTLVPDTWTFSLNAMRQKVDGLMDITAREAGSFYTPGRTTLIPAGQGGAQDITDWDDTALTTVSAQLDYAVAKAWTLSAGYLYEKYDFKDAFNSSDLLMSQAVYIFLRANDRAYNANVVYAKLNYRF